MRDLLVVLEPAGYEPVVGSALWRLNDARRRLLDLLEEVPSELVDRELDGNSVGTVLYHIALIEADWLFTEILEEPLPPELEGLFPAEHRDEAGILTIVRGESIEQHLSRLSAVRRVLSERLRGMSAPEFNRPRSLPNYDVSPAWVLHHLAQHEAEHRAEIGSIVASRPLG